MQTNMIIISKIKYHTIISHLVNTIAASKQKTHNTTPKRTLLALIPLTLSVFLFLSFSLSKMIIERKIPKKIVILKILDSIFHSSIYTSRKLIRNVKTKLKTHIFESSNSIHLKYFSQSFNFFHSFFPS